MKRDMDLVRHILVAVESAGPEGVLSTAIADQRWSVDDVGYHMLIMREAGLVEANIVKAMSHAFPRAQVSRLTWYGHEMLDAVRDDTVWRKLQARLEDTVQGAPIEIMLAMAKALIRERLGLDV